MTNHYPTKTTRIGRLKCDFSIIEAIGTVILWIILTVVTFGLALLVFPCYLNRAVLNRTQLLNAAGQPIARLNCTFNIGIPLGT